MDVKELKYNKTFVKVVTVIYDHYRRGIGAILRSLMVRIDQICTLKY